MGNRSLHDLVTTNSRYYSVQLKALATFVKTTLIWQFYLKNSRIKFWNDRLHVIVDVELSENINNI